MKVYGINGSPRKTGNTATLLEEALAGARAAGAETERIDLYDLEYRGCYSCFDCRKLGGESYGRCAQRDGLTPTLDKLHTADAILFASPVYCGSVSGEMTSFLERFLYPYSSYDEDRSSLYGRKIRTGFLYTMNAVKERMEKSGWSYGFRNTEGAIEWALGPLNFYCSFDTWQFDDYSLYETGCFDVPHKAQVHKDQFPIDRKKSFELGNWCAGGTDTFHNNH